MGAPQNFASVSRRQPDVEDYIDMLRRHRSWIIAPAFAGLVISVVVAFCWPDTFISKAVMRIAPQKVPVNLMPSVVGGQMEQQLEQMKMDVLGRTNLIQLIRMPSLNLYPKERDRMPDEDIAEQMRVKQWVRIDPINNPGADPDRGARAFQISFEYPDRNKAQMVVTQLVSKFQEKNLAVRQGQNDTTNQFLNDEVKRAKLKLDAREADIALFAAENQGRLPENFQANMQEVNSRETAINSLQESIAQEKQKQILLESQLQSLKAAEFQAQSNMEQTQTTGNSAVRNQALFDINNTIMKLNLDLEASLKKYTEGMPEIQTYKAQIKNLEDRRDKLEKQDQLNAANQQGPTARVVPNPQAVAALQNYQNQEKNIQAQMSVSQLDIETRSARVAVMQKQLKDAQDKIAASPAIIQKNNGLQSAYNMAKEEYELMVHKKDQSDTAQSMQEHQAGETLELLEPALAPLNAAYPSRTLWIIVGTLAGIGLGLVSAAAKEIKNTSLKNLKDVRAYTNLPVLSSIPLLENALLVRRKRRLAWLAWSSALIVGSVLMTGAVYYYVTTKPGIS